MGKTLNPDKRFWYDGIVAYSEGEQMTSLDAKPHFVARLGARGASLGRSLMRYRLAAAAVVCFAFLAGDALSSDLPVASDSSPLRRVEVTSTDAVTLARELAARGFDVLHGSVDGDSLELIVSEASLRRLGELGLEPRTLEVGRPFRQIQAERSGGEPPEVPTGYPDLAEILAQMSAAAAAFPSICQVVDLTEEYGTPPTFEGRHMFAVKISDNVEQDEDEPATLIVSNHHARELVTPVIALHAMEQLTTGYGSDPVITDLVNEYEIWIAPTWNPDGYEYVFNVNNMWRKNRRVFPDGVGVDLNRNHLFGWHSTCSGSEDPSLWDHKGPAPASEPETQTMIAFSGARNFAKVMDYHSYGRLTLWGYACISHPLSAYLSQEGGAISQAHGYGSLAGPAGSNGYQYQYQLALHGAYAFLVETATQFQPPFFSAEAEASQVFEGLVAALERPIPVHGRVTDATTGGPLAARISYGEVDFENCETNQSAGLFGRYHAFLPAGQFTIRFCAAGYLPQAHPVAVSAAASTLLDVALVPGMDAACEESLVDCNGNLMTDTCELNQGFAADCNATGVPDECEIADGTSLDCNLNGTPDICDVTQQPEIDCDDNLVPDDCDIAQGTSADCNTNGVPDTCDVSKDPQIDCNGNEVPDSCDVAAGTSEDCNTNGRPDLCEVAELSVADCNSNGIPDECEGLVPRPPANEAPAFPKNRFLSFVPRNHASLTALRVTFSDLPPPFDLLNGEALYVGPPHLVNEKGADVEPGSDSESFTAALLGCTPHFRDWNDVGLIHVFHESIVPGGSYDVQAISVACDPAIESSFSASLSLSTAGYGDTVTDLGQIPPGAPDGSVRVVDILAVLGRFGNVEGSIIKARADLEPGCLDLIINVTDVLSAIAGFQDLAYPFTPTSLDPCASTCTSPFR